MNEYEQRVIDYLDLIASRLKITMIMISIILGLLLGQTL